MGERVARLIAVLVLWAASALAMGVSKKVAAIDQYCQSVEAEFTTGPSLMFAGPDPWVQIDLPPSDMSEGAFAYVYTEGVQVLWVFLREFGDDRKWVQDTNYFYRPDGTLARRDRSLITLEGNLSLDVTEYYEHGEVIKEVTHHRALGHGKENLNAFQDHEPPQFLTTDELPFEDGEMDLRRRLALAGQAVRAGIDRVAWWGRRPW
jgi:hypothetical protein